MKMRCLKNGLAQPRATALFGERDKTKLEIEMTTDEAFEKMFNTGWPKALEIIKSLCEKN